MDTDPDFRHAMPPLSLERLTCCWQLNASGVPEMVWTRMVEEQHAVSPTDVPVVRAADIMGASNPRSTRRRLAA